MKITGSVLITLLFSVLFFYGCGSSTDSRYDKSDKESEEEKTTETKEKETPSVPFDFTPFHSTFDFEKDKPTKEYTPWYGYDSVDINKEDGNIIEVSGFRVEVKAAESLDEANSLKAELNFSIPQKVYIIFDPPFYRVRVGDYEKRNSAEDQLFKLRQMGYQESRVVTDSVRISSKQ